MQELKVLEQKQGLVTINYEELKQEFEVALKKYRGLVVTPENINDAKKDKSTLNKVYKKIEDKRIALKEYIMQPYIEVEKQFKELSGMVKQCSDDLKLQLDTFDEKEKKDKLIQIKTIFEDLNLIPELKLDMIFNEKWYNKGFTIKNIVEEIQTKLAKVRSDLIYIKALDKDNYELLKNCYFKKLDLNQVLELKNDLTLVTTPKSEENISTSQKEVNFDELEDEVILTFVVKGKKEDVKLLGEYIKNNNMEILSVGREE